MRGEAWTVERIDLLRKLWAEGETATAIGTRLGGLSRSAVLGKIFRLRLGADDAGAVFQAEQNVAAQGRGAKARRRPAAGTQSSRSASAPHALDPTLARRRRGAEQYSPSPPAAATRRKTLLELTNQTCRWPHGRPGTGRFFFCGTPEADLQHGIPYCARHMRRAYGAPASVEDASPGASGGMRSSPAATKFARFLLSLGTGSSGGGKT